MFESILGFWNSADLTLRFVIVCVFIFVLLLIIGAINLKIHPELLEAQELKTKQREDERQAKIKYMKDVINGTQNLTILIKYLEGIEHFKSGANSSLELTPTEISISQDENKSASLFLAKIINANITKLPPTKVGGLMHKCITT